MQDLSFQESTIPEKKEEIVKKDKTERELLIQLIEIEKYNGKNIRRISNNVLFFFWMTIISAVVGVFLILELTT